MSATRERGKGMCESNIAGVEPHDDIRRVFLTRREFLERSSAAAAALAAAPRVTARRLAPATADSAIRELCMVALDAARRAGASYADIRVVDRRDLRIATRLQRVTGVDDRSSFGFGVRVAVGGAWGFAASPDVTRDECVAVARRAVEEAKAISSARRTIALAPVDAVPAGSWQTPIEVDPFAVPLDEKIELLLAVNAAALKVHRVHLVTSTLDVMRRETTFASTNGSVVVQTLYRTYPHVRVTAVSDDGLDFQSRTSSEVPPMGRGYEHVREADLENVVPTWAEEAASKLSATAVTPGVYDLILDPSHLALTLHETIGRATELDRALGYEADFGGTSFLTPPDRVVRQFRYGPEFMNVQADRTQAGGLATTRWDDEGVPADSWPLVQDGVFMDYQTTREQAGWIAHLTGITASHGCAGAESWDQVQLQTMPNVSLLPGEDAWILDDLVAATDRGIVIKGAGSYSIDQQGYDFRFGGQVAYEVRDGKIVGMLRDVGYVGRAPDFWNSLDMLGGAAGYMLGGTLGDAKGQPPRVHAASHGCPPARFRGVEIVSTAGAA